MKHTESQQTYKIGQVARKLEISVELIRAYEHEGILLTDKTDKGQRVFTESDIRWLRCIRRLIKEHGLNIEGIRRLLALMPCWDMRGCTESERHQCPAFHRAEKPCWLMKDSIPESCRDENCRHCSVYTQAIQCENLKSVMYAPYVTNNTPDTA